MYVLLPKIFNLICLLPTLDDWKLFGLYIASNSETLKKVIYIRLTVENTLVNFKFLSSDRDAGEFCPIEKVISKIIILRTTEHQSVLYLI